MRGIIIALVLLVCYASAYNNGLGRLPPMGWNTWCTDDICGLRDKCSDEEIRSVADAMVEQNMVQLGYEYITMDDCWSATSRNATGNLQPDPDRFPHGMKALADYVHGKGLKIGLYTCVGTQTCRGGRPGSFGHFEEDAETVADWGIDFVKADNCHRPAGFTEHELYGNFSRALNATGRPILFSLCEWGDSEVWKWGGTVGQMWRVQMDHLPLWHLPTKAAGQGFGQGTSDIIEYVATVKPSQWVSPYNFLDPDFLETLFPFTMPFTDSRTEFSFWALWSAPLLVATDIRKMSEEKRKILMNPEVIAIDQDPACHAGDRVMNATNGGQVWAKSLHDESVAVILYNPHEIEHIDVAVRWEDLLWRPNATAIVRDLWEQKDLGTHQAGYGTRLGPHSVLLCKVTLVPTDD